MPVSGHIASENRDTRLKNAHLPQKSKNRKSRLDKSSKPTTLARSKISKRFDTAWTRSRHKGHHQQGEERLNDLWFVAMTVLAAIASDSVLDVAFA